MRTTTAIDTAEREVRSEIDSIVTALLELHARAENLKTDGSRLTALKALTADLECAIRFGIERWKTEAKDVPLRISA